MAIALTPFVSGLLGAAVLYVIFVHPYGAGNEAVIAAAPSTSA